MNPIIETVDAGHVNHGNRCRLCRTEWPCEPILAAREHNKTYVPITMPEAVGPIEPHKDHL